METLDDLYLRFDSAIPATLYDRTKAGSLNAYTRQIAHAAERQFERIFQETQAQIKHYRLADIPLFSPTTLRHLSNQLFYHRNRAIEARLIKLKNRA